MSIKDLAQKVKNFLVSESTHDLYIVLIIILVAFASFGLGRLSKTNVQDLNKQSITIEYPPGFQQAGLLSSLKEQGEEIPQKGSLREENNFVSSKNGSKYHFPWCPGAKQIKEENKIWFTTSAEAEAAGYTAAANCKGL